MVGPAPARRRERYWRARGARHIVGIDEAGRGPLAGPVVAAAVILPKGCRVRGARDSKQLDSRTRERLFGTIHERASAVGWAAVGPRVVDQLNILRASELAMRLAAERLPTPPDIALIDGNPVADFPHVQEAIVRGDSRELVISCASIVAKVMRDRIMALYDSVYPDYGFARHKGYPTPEHMVAIELPSGSCLSL
jgi:ribonuclease HII